jgi:hypothetical protein
MNDYQYAVMALIELRNNALLLTIGNEHLKDDVYLVKIGNNISRAIDILYRDISALKKEYPGKLMNEVDTDIILEKINTSAQRLMKPSKETKEEHALGQLGREVESNVNSITGAVEDMRMKIHGTPTDHAPTRSATNGLIKFKDIFLSAGSLLRWAVKVIVCIIVLFAAIFGYFYFTMEKDAKYMNEISSTEAVLKEKKQIVPKLQKEKQELMDRQSLMNKELTMEEKVAAMDIEVKIKKLDSAIDQADAEISVYEQKLKENQDKLNALRKKPFIKRLLKQ